ncbi:Rieske 2Fe-2S domain-containing protein [Peterkaempfera griseoplana]|uniref:Rieske 2Fe-2S domain-containing protein n=1 Tax=Peterkaempfera griseoplana TaxID=66896 RepID=UPI00099F2512|nr:Rieske (2Fe-2S) protein [Peterkaempfera griseoplana]
MRHGETTAKNPATLASADGHHPVPTERLLGAVDGLERQSVLDAAVEPLQRLVRALPLGRGRDLLRGLWLGHPLHPALVQLPIGAWTSAAVLDLMPGESRAARRLVALGLAGALPAAAAGWVDWAEQHRQQQRVGLVHAAANAAAVALYTGSLTARRRGRGLTGRALGFAGLAMATGGGILGGHLAYRQAVGANHAEDVAHLVEPGWHVLGRLGEFPEGRAVRRVVDEIPVLVVRDGGTAHVLADRCSHLSGPLSEGRIADGCVECPWHGSVFRLSDGANVRGPATARQPAFETRVTMDRLEIRLPDATHHLRPSPMTAGAGG